MRATTIKSAYYSALTSYDREVWSTDDVPYVPRTAAQDGQRRPVHVRLEEALREGRQQFVLTGQKGSGKSTELHQLRARLGDRFEVVVVDGSEQLNLDRFVDIRFVLVAMAASVARRIQLLDGRYVGRAGMASTDAQRLREWVRVLTHTEVVPNADQVDWRAVFAQIGDALTGVTVDARSDDSLRARLLGAEVSATRNLVTLLTDELARLSGRDVVFIVDDLDKLTDPESWKHLYRDHLLTLRALPVRWVITMPYALGYDPEVSAPSDRLIVLPNVKVVERGAPDRLLPESAEYFQKIAAAVVDPVLFDAAASDRAARMSAGNPREFLRILRTAFGVAYELGLTRVGVPEVELAEAQLRRELQRFHADPRVTRSLELVKARPGKIDAHQRGLMGMLLIVEYSNGEQWYDTNPLLSPEYERRISERAARLKVGRDDTDALVRDIEGKDAS